MEAILEFFSTRNDNPPTLFGALHLLVLGLSLLAIVCICLFMRKTSDKVNRIILIMAGSWLLLFEVIKQIVLIYDGGAYNYNWHHLPLQPCSALMYSILIAGLICNSKNIKLKALSDLFLCFVAIYGFFSGMSAIIMPGALFPEPYLFLVYQSLQHHVILALLAVYLFASNRVPLILKSFLKALLVFALYCGFALVLNLSLYAIFKNPSINMMYMGPYTVWEIPLISALFNIEHYALFLPLYLLGYSGATLLSEYLCRGVRGFSCKVIKRA